MPYIDCEIDDWNFNVEFPIPDDDDEYSCGLVLHGETTVWGCYDRVSFEVDVYLHNGPPSPYGVVMPVREPETNHVKPSVYIEIKTDKEAFQDLIKCLIECAKNEKLSSFLLIQVGGLEIDIDYVWPEGKRLDVIGWSYHIKYRNKNKYLG